MPARPRPVPAAQAWQLLTGSAPNTRYPGPQLLPAVLEAGGRWGREFRLWARAVLPESPRRGDQLADLRCRLAVALQRGVAAALLAASSGAVRPWSAC